MRPLFEQKNAFTFKLLALIAIIGLLTTFRVSANGQILLGPPGSGTSSGRTNWLTGAGGAGSTSLDFNDPGTSGYDLTMSNTVAGKENKADWRCPAFSLGAAAGGARPITFSFAYKLADSVAAGDNIEVALRFFDAPNNCIGGGAFNVGTHSQDAAMTEYRKQTLSDILAPAQARTADIWITANVFKPWVSGTARFADFSVTTVPRSPGFKMVAAAAVLAGICIVTFLLIQLWRRSQP